MSCDAYCNHLETCETCNAIQEVIELIEKEKKTEERDKILDYLNTLMFDHYQNTEADYGDYLYEMYRDIQEDLE